MLSLFLYGSYSLWAYEFAVDTDKHIIHNS